VTICHRTHSKKHPFVTITIAPSALKAHLRHGDLLGPCTAAKIKKMKGKANGKNAGHGHGSDHGKGNGKGHGKGH
jgi:hypothetical protein